ncbi:MAG: efflux RND transporter periplasmic adaptor subunit [Proteobacteria bacterium]|nr:efflux RND transporter periplasmic adaptor subunit [Pseudomonadota bacterium]
MTAPKIVKFILPVVIVAVGVGTARFVISQKKQTEKKAPEARIASVEYVEVAAGAPRARIEATGTVEGDRQVSLSSLVIGEVVYVADALDPGGRFRRGATLLRVDPRDYEAAVAQEASRVRKAELDVELEKQRGATAAREWDLLSEGRDASEAPLALRGPQLATAEAALVAAQSGHDRAKLNLERTSLQAPFNAMVLNETAELGQVLSPGAPIVTLVGTDRFRVRVAIPVEQLAHVAIPGINGSDGSTARVVQDLGGGQRIEREARVTQLAGQLDPQTRTAELYLAIDKPLAGDGLPLLPGAFVKVEIDGLPVDGAIAVPRDALVDGAILWTVSSEETLQRRDVTVGWRDGSTAFVIDGLDGGARVVTTPLSLPIEGAPVRASAQEG